MWISLRFLFFSSFRTEKALHQDGLWCKASNFFLYVFMSFFDVFSGAPYGSDFLILTKGIIKKVPKRSAKKWRNKLQNNSILLFIILLFFSCVQEIQCLTYNTTHALIVSFCILNKSLFLFWSHPYSYVFFFAIFWCFSSQTYHFPSTSTVYY